MADARKDMKTVPVSMMPELQLAFNKGQTSTATRILEKHPEQFNSVDNSSSPPMTPLDHFARLSDRGMVFTLCIERKISPNTAYLTSNGLVKEQQTLATYNRPHPNYAFTPATQEIYDELTETKSLVDNLCQYETALAQKDEKQLGISENYIGTFYRVHFVEPDKAREWYEQSNAHKNPDALLNLALNYYSHDPQTYQMAAEAFHRLHPISPTARNTIEHHLLRIAYDAKQKSDARPSDKEQQGRYVACMALADIAGDSNIIQIGTKSWKEHLAAARNLATEASLNLPQCDESFFQSMALLEHLVPREPASKINALKLEEKSPSVFFIPATTDGHSGSAPPLVLPSPRFVFIPAAQIPPAAAADVTVRVLPTPVTPADDLANLGSNYLEQGIQTLAKSAEAGSVEAWHHLVRISQDEKSPVTQYLALRLITTNEAFKKADAKKEFVQASARRYEAAKKGFEKCHQAFTFLYDIPFNPVLAATHFEDQAKAEKLKGNEKAAGDAYLFSASALQLKQHHVSSLQAYEKAHDSYVLAQHLPCSLLCRTISNLSMQMQKKEEIDQYVKTVLHCYRKEVEKSPVALMNINTLGQGIARIYQNISSDEKKAVANALATLYRTHQSHSLLCSQIQADIAALDRNFSPADLSDEPTMLLDHARAEIADPSKLDVAVKHFKTALNNDFRNGDYTHAKLVLASIKKAAYESRLDKTSTMKIETVVRDAFNHMKDSKDAAFKQYLLDEAYDLVLHYKTESTKTPELSIETKYAVLGSTLADALATPSTDLKQLTFLRDAGQYHEAKGTDAVIGFYDTLVRHPHAAWEEKGEKESKKSFALDKLLTFAPGNSEYQKLAEARTEYFRVKKLNEDITANTTRPITVEKLTKLVELETKSAAEEQQMELALKRGLTEQYHLSGKDFASFQNFQPFRQEDGSLKHQRAVKIVKQMIALLENLANEPGRTEYRYSRCHDLVCFIANIRSGLDNNHSQKNDLQKAAEEAGRKEFCLVNRNMIEHTDHKYNFDEKNIPSPTLIELSKQIQAAKTFRDAQITEKTELEKYRAAPSESDAETKAKQALREARDTIKSHALPLAKQNWLEANVHLAKEYKGDDEYRRGRLVLNARICVLAHNSLQKDLYPENKLKKMRDDAFQYVSDHAAKAGKHRGLATALKKQIEALDKKTAPVEDADRWFLEKLHESAADQKESQHELADHLEESYCVGLSEAFKNFGEPPHSMVRALAQNNCVPALRFFERKHAGKTSITQDHQKQALALNMKIVLVANPSSKREEHIKKQAQGYINKHATTSNKKHNHDMARAFNSARGVDSGSIEGNVDIWLTDHLSAQNDSPSTTTSSDRKDSSVVATYVDGIALALAIDFAKNLSEERKRLEQQQRDRKLDRKVSCARDVNTTSHDVEGAVAVTPSQQPATAPPAYSMSSPYGPLAAAAAGSSTASMNSAMSARNAEGSVYPNVYVGGVGLSSRDRVTTVHSSTTTTTTTVVVAGAAAAGSSSPPPPLPPAYNPNAVGATSSTSGVGTASAFTPTIGRAAADASDAQPAFVPASYSSPSLLNGDR